MSPSAPPRSPAHRTAGGSSPARTIGAASGRPLLEALLLAAAGTLAACDGAQRSPPRDLARRPSAAPGAMATATRASGDPRGPLLDEAATLLGQRRYREAREILEELLAEHPGAPRATFYLALTYHKERRYQAASTWYDLLLERREPFEDAPRVAYFAGWCFYHLGRLDDATRAFRFYLEGVPASADARFGLGLVHLDAGRLAEALAELRRAAELAGDDASLEARARTRLADVLAATGRLEEAREELAAATRRRPEQSNAYYKLYQVLLRLGREDEARRALERFESLKGELAGDTQ